MENWEVTEERVGELFPRAKKTKGSGSVHGDGDLRTSSMILEVKDHQRVSFDSWWKKIRKTALEWGKEPVLVIRRPTIFGVGEELVACVRAEFLAELINGQEETNSK